MQYSFDFTKKPETPDLNLSHLDYAKLSGFADFAEKLSNFNDRYNMDLVATKGSRWQPGTYNKIKANVDKIVYPHWESRRGANSIAKLLERNRWSYDCFKQQLNELDSILYGYRKGGIELYSNDDLDKAKELLCEVLDKFTTGCKDIKLSIEPIPHAGKKLRGYLNQHGYSDSSSDKIARLYPIISKDNKIIGSYNAEMYKGLEDYQQRLYDNSQETNPAKWFINIRVALRNININVTNSEMNKEYATFPYGDLILCFTFDLVTLLTNYRRIIAKQHLIKTEFIGVTATKFPIYLGLEHPFVYKLSDTPNNNMINYFNTYGSGNVCLGDLTSDIYSSLLTGNLELLKSYLHIWASSFSAGVTSPLNAIGQSTFGVHKEWNSNVRGIIAGSSYACSKQIKEYKTNEDRLVFADKFCTNCALIETCKIAKNIGMLGISWADEANGNWIQAFNKLSMHLTNEVDTSIVHEMFADLYYFYKNNLWKEYSIHRVFHSCDNIVDYNDFNSYISMFIEDGPTEDNIIKIFEVYNRNFILTQIYNENMQMFEELTNKTHDCTFDEASTKLTIRTIEDTHYSWLFAIGSISNRSEYYTYIKSLNSRREGLRYEY